MKYIEWKKTLEENLSCLDKMELETVLAYYEELYQDKISFGMESEEIIESFGHANEVASELIGGLGILASYDSEDSEEENTNKNQKGHNEKKSSESKRTGQRTFKEDFSIFQEGFNRHANKFCASVKKGFLSIVAYFSGKKSSTEKDETSATNATGSTKNKDSANKNGESKSYEMKRNPKYAEKDYSAFYPNSVKTPVNHVANVQELIAENQRKSGKSQNPSKPSSAWRSIKAILLFIPYITAVIILWSFGFSYIVTAVSFLVTGILCVLFSIISIFLFTPFVIIDLGVSMIVLGLGVILSIFIGTISKAMVKATACMSRWTFC